MAERKSGSVKPPVIDLKARDASRGEAKPARGRTASRPARRDPVAEEATPNLSPQAPQDSAPSQAPSTITAEATDQAARAPEPATVEASDKDASPRAQETADRPRAATGPAAPPPPRQAKLAMPWSAISLAAVVGAVLGTALTYALVGLLPLPESAPPIPDPSPRLAGLESAVADIDSRLTPLTAADDELRTTATALQTELAAQDQSIAGLGQRLDEVAALAEQTVDLAPLTGQLLALEDRVSAMGAGASSADAAALAENLTTIETELAELRTQLEAVRAQATMFDRLNTELTNLRASVAAQNRTLAGTSIGPAVQLPLLVSGLESAFAAGRSFATELAALQSILPELQPPPPVTAAAETGLPRPDRVVAQFEAAVPAILAGRTAISTGDFGQDALEWAKALLALRPTGEMDGDTPDAIVSRLEGAVAREDFTTAADLLESLPQPMRDAAGGVGEDIMSLAAAAEFIAALRAEAIAPVTGTAP